MLNPELNPELQAEAGDAILKWIIQATPKCTSYSYLLSMAEAYALVNGTLSSKGSQVKVEK